MFPVRFLFFDIVNMGRDTRAALLMKALLRLFSLCISKVKLHHSCLGVC